MTLPHSVSEVLRDHVVLESESIDRMYLNVYVPQLQRVGGVVWYLRGHLGQRFASTATVAPKTVAFVARVPSWDTKLPPVCLLHCQRPNKKAPYTGAWGLQ